MKCIIKEINQQNLAVINLWRNDKEVIDNLGNNFRFISEDIDNNWFQNYTANRTTNVRLGIYIPDHSEIVGMVNLTNIHPVNANAEFSIVIGNKSFWGKGLGFEATKKIIEHGFNDLNLHSIYLTVLSYNIPAISLYKKVGFVVEGEMKECIFKNGSFKNLIMMRIFNNKEINF